MVGFPQKFKNTIPWFSMINNFHDFLMHGIKSYSVVHLKVNFKYSFLYLVSPILAASSPK